MFLKSVGFRQDVPADRRGYPFSLAWLAGLDRIEFRRPVTILTGDNGTGKSTLLEALAAAVGSVTVGAESVETDPSLEPARRLARTMRLSWSVRTRKGFFLRSEDFLNFARKIAQIRADMQRSLAEAEEEYRDRSAFARSQAAAPYRKSIAELERYYGEDLDARSHGESFLRLFQSRFGPGGLYLLDEPETPLSPTKQLAFLSMLKEMTEQGSQFVIATHSPILMAFPDADLLSFDHAPIRRVTYDELEHVQLMRAFLENPGRFLRHL